MPARLKGALQAAVADSLPVINGVVVSHLTPKAYDFLTRWEPRSTSFETEQQTYFKARRRAYQLDHVFSDAETIRSDHTWRVLTEAVTTEPPLSDHAPIEIVVDIE